MPPLETWRHAWSNYWMESRHLSPLRAQVAEGVLEMQQKHRVTPGLAAVLVGYDPASAVYVRNKERACAEVGILSEVLRLEQDVSEEELLETVARLNADSRYHGIPSCNFHCPMP